jgi:hypothetical protein
MQNQNTYTIIAPVEERKTSENKAGINHDPADSKRLAVRDIDQEGNRSRAMGFSCEPREKGIRKTRRR